MIENIYNYLPLNESLSSSGMPTPEQLPAIAENGFEVVINLATSKSEGAIPNEKELVESLGVSYFNIPVEWNAPTRENLDEFMRLMDEHKNEKVLVHCQANFRATGFITLYRILRLGWQRDDAYKDMQRIWDPSEHAVWEQFFAENLGE